MIGVTGTQGKTTTTRLAEGGLRGRRRPRRRDRHRRHPDRRARTCTTALTTPEAPDLHGLFATMREREVVACAMEVSSHALVLGRVDGVVFDVAVFLNLGRDHLDFHADVEDYYRAKASLFTPERARRGLVNVDDEHGRRLVGEAAHPAAHLLHGGRCGGLAGERRRPPRPSGSRFTDPRTGRAAGGRGRAAARRLQRRERPRRGGRLRRGRAGPGRGGRGRSPRVAGVPGRFERVEAGQDFIVVVDYAHKPDAVAAALGTLRPLTDGRVIVVLGAGGDRDPGKRPIMGEIAARLADVLVVTDDNPRTEDPATIRAALLDGAAAGRAEVVEVGDRRAAIATALGLRPGRATSSWSPARATRPARRSAAVVHPFDDRVVVARAARAAARPEPAEAGPARRVRAGGRRTEECRADRPAVANTRA